MEKINDLGKYEWFVNLNNFVTFVNKLVQVSKFCFIALNYPAMNRILIDKQQNNPIEKKKKKIFRGKRSQPTE